LWRALSDPGALDGLSPSTIKAETGSLPMAAPIIKGNVDAR
jgi:hypothetical protein